MCVYGVAVKPTTAAGVALWQAHASPRYSAELEALVPCLTSVLEVDLEHCVTALEVLEVYACIADADFLTRHSPRIAAFFLRVRSVAAGGRAFARACGFTRACACVASTSVCLCAALASVLACACVCVCVCLCVHACASLRVCGACVAASLRCTVPGRRQVPGRC